ncbi:gem-associated protein 4 isoform X2 [Oryzias latipes]|uniref:Gem (nuclear organelle) associated protein 4 n=1 Tax=Oryzias latipes TaxID=8090 RepID=H2M1T4_ORYLA|nr:gem-associated protein 4 isoform X2 [Oryzias latipes]
MDKGSAVLQGAFLLADKLCRPSFLSCVNKSDWIAAGRPILQALQEVCELEEADGHHSSTWTKKVVCAVWLKLLSAEEDVERAWRENPFFSFQQSLPEVNHVVLLELVKNAAASHVYAGFLLHLPEDLICLELKRLVEHVKSEPTSEEDVHFFLEMWRELWKGQEQAKLRNDESMEMMFAKQVARLTSMSSSLSPQAAKRLKLETQDSAEADVFHILLNALKDMADHVSSLDLCFQSLSMSLDALFTSFLIDREVVLSAQEKMDILCKAISTKGKNEKLQPELVEEAQRHLRASISPSQFKVRRMDLGEALRVIAELSQSWKDRGLLDVQDGSRSSYSAFQLEQSVQRVSTALEEAPTAATEKNLLVAVLKSLVLPVTESSPEVHAQVLSTIITHRLEDHESFAALFAREPPWTHCDEGWMDCLERSQASFRQHDAVIGLSSTLMNKLRMENADVSQCRKLMKIIADIFSSLSLEDMNKALVSMLRLSRKGFFEFPVPPEVAGGFEQELNMAFNCIIQAGSGASSAVPQGNLTTAVSLVARVAFQNPEGALRSCCHSAVFNKGAFSMMAKILQHLPGLSGQRGGDGDGRRSGEENTAKDGTSSLLCRCLHQTVKDKSLSANEKEQFAKFLGLLMGPNVDEGKEQSFLSPQEVINTFVLPNLSSVGSSSVDAELSLQLLHTALSLDVQPGASSSHWLMDCSPFPLLFVLAQIHDQNLRFWEEPPKGGVRLCSVDTKELLVSVMTTVGQVVGAEVAAAPSSWSRALFWLYNKLEELDWTVRFHLKPLWGQHFKNEVPSSLLDVCDLPEQEWCGLDLPPYGQGTGLLAWLECCSLSDSLQSTMLSCLSLDQHQPHHVNMFSKGLLVGLTQILPWCSVSQWSRVLKVLKELIASNRLNVPFSLEYVEFLPLLDLRQFSCELRVSVLLLRAFQLLCGSSCSHWLPADGWAHAGRLYAHAVRNVLSSVKVKLQLPTASTAAVSESTPPEPAPSGDPNSAVSPYQDSCMNGRAPPDPGVSKEGHVESKSQEVLFVLSQLFCHVQHIQVMMPGGQSEPLFLCSLEILSSYEAIMAAFPDSCSPLESDNTRHFFSTITDNLLNQEMKAVLQQKIAQLVSSAA